MQLNPGSSLGIVDDIDFLASTSTVSYPTADKVRNINRWYYIVATDIWKAQRKWQWDDTNQTTHAIATADLVDSQQDYAMPTTAFGIDRVEVKDNAGNFYKLIHIDSTDITGGLSEFQETAGTPRYYDMQGGSLFLYPKPSSSQVTTSGGLKIYVKRDIDEFAAADTTQEPGFAEPFHRILSLGGAYDWLLAHEQIEKATSIRAEIEALRTSLKEFYGEQNSDIKTRIQPAHRTQYYI